MNHKPLFNRLIVREIRQGIQTPGGLFIPDIAQDNKTPFRYGEVLSTGTGKSNEPMQVSIGDVVMFLKKSGINIPLTDNHGDDDPGILLQETDVLSIVTELPRDTGLVGLDGGALQLSSDDRRALENDLRIRPTSRGIPDKAYQNAAELDEARRAGWDTGHPDHDETLPGEG